ncbi:hypothetical protein ABW19_dt0206560 [Dactylella cylindrospora]|nr:hypothetical protein ABW19_dt0206560 [Dactylella cylindrospora]
MRIAPAIYLLALYETHVAAFEVGFQWATADPWTQDLRSFQEESALFNSTTPMQQFFNIRTDRTHNRVRKACKKITHPWTQNNDREERDYLRRQAYVKAIRISQTPNTFPPDEAAPPFTHPWQRSARGVAFFDNDNCADKPKFIIWPKQAFDMNYPTARRYDQYNGQGEVENGYYKFWQTFEFADFDVKRDPNARVNNPPAILNPNPSAMEVERFENNNPPKSHYNIARPRARDYLDPGDEEGIAAFRKQYWLREYLEKNEISSPMGSPYHQPFGSFREIFPTRADRIWRQMLHPSGDKSYWDIPMINVQLDHRNGGGKQKKDAFRSFVPYALLDRSMATVFEVIEEEYAIFYSLMVDQLGLPGDTWVKRLRWVSSRQEWALKRLESLSDFEAPDHSKELRAAERFLGRNRRLRNYELLTTSPDPEGTDTREWTLPPSWLNVPVFDPHKEVIINTDEGAFLIIGAYDLVPNPNRIIYSSVTIDYQKDGSNTIKLEPVMSNPELAIQKETVQLLEELPYAEFLSESSRRVSIKPDYARPETELGANGDYYGRLPMLNTDLQGFTGRRQRYRPVEYNKRPEIPNPVIKEKRPVGRQRSDAVFSRPGYHPPPTSQRIVPNPNAQMNMPAEYEGEQESNELTVSRVPGGRTRYSPVSSPLMSPMRSLAGSGSSSRGSLGVIPENQEDVTISNAGTISSISEMQSSIANSDASRGARGIEGAAISSPRIAQAKNIPTTNIDLGGSQSGRLLEIVSGKTGNQFRQPKIESLAGSRIGYSPSYSPRNMLESQSSLLQSRRKRLPNEIEFLENSVISYRPPDPQDLRGSLLKASTLISRDGEVEIPILDDKFGLTVSMKVKSRYRGAPNQKSPNLLKISGTGKKEECIEPIAIEPFDSGCFGLVCCNGRDSN